MHPYLSDHSIVITGHSESLVTAFHSSGSNNRIISISADAAASVNSSKSQKEMRTAFGHFDNDVDVFIIDARSQEPSGQDAIWEISLSEWEKVDSPISHQQRMLGQARLFLDCQIKAGIPHPSLQSKGHGFTIVILGQSDTFEVSLKRVISKLQRDVSRLHPSASVSFLDISSSHDASDQSIVLAMGKLIASKTAGEIVALDDMSSIHRIDEGAPGSSVTQEASLPLRTLPPQKKPKIKIALSFDFDAVSAFLGTGHHPDNNLADYSTGVFSGRVGARRILHMLQKHQVADKVTWFIPGHTMETFESTVKEIVASGAEIGLHGYSHEGAYQMTPAQERDVLVKCMEISQRMTGKRVRGYRAPMYQLRETTIELLREFEFLYDSSLSHHDSQPYFTPSDPPIKPVDFSQPASSWLHPTPLAAANTRPVGHPLVEIPTGWNNEDMMALQYFPHLDNSHGHVDARVVEQRWKDMFLWLWQNAHVDGGDGSSIFPILMHPDTSGMAHVIGMVDRFVDWLKGWGDAVQFHTFSEISQEWLEEQGGVC